MPLRIEDYALVGDTRTAALVGRDGSIDWLCAPCFSSDACFAALLGDERHGRFLVGSEAGGLAVSRRYRPGSLVLETTFEVDGGAVRVVDAMPLRRETPALVRVVEGLRVEEWQPPQRRRLPRLLVLAGGRSLPARTPRRCARALRTRPRDTQRRRAALRGV